MYDALNVLMAMDIIAKERKEISWRGLPSNSKDELEALKVCCFVSGARRVVVSSHP